jgi:hypothetical protein
MDYSLIDKYIMDISINSYLCTRGVMSGWGYSACKVTTQDTDIPGEELQSLAPAW